MLLLSRRTGLKEKTETHKYIKLTNKYAARNRGCDTDLWWSIEGIRVKDGLHHDEGLCQVLPDKVVPVVGGLIWAVVEHL